jgi:hypothetical protein
MSDHSLQRTSEEIQKIVADACAKSTRSWVPANRSSIATIEQARSQFALILIPPEQGGIEVGPDVSEILNIEHGTLWVWFLTSPQTQRVFFDECRNLFGVAWGPDSATGKYLDLGFRTDDPIDAFLA